MNLTPRVATRLQTLTEHVTALTSVLDLAVLDRHPTKRHYQLRVLRYIDEMGLLIHVVVEGEPKDVRSDDVPGGDRVVVDRVRISADCVEEAVDLAFRVVEPPALAQP